jgi:hypothetical protein
LGGARGLAAALAGFAAWALSCLAPDLAAGFAAGFAAAARNLPMRSSRSRASSCAAAHCWSAIA